MRNVFSFGIAALFTGALLAQTKAPPAPAWPANDKPPTDLHGNYVYIDQPNSAIVIAIPGSLRGKPAEPPELIRVPYHNRFDPEVVASISRTGRDQYLYVYFLANGKSAADIVNSWQIAASCGGQLRIDAHPLGWRCLRLEHSSLRQYALPYIAGPVCPVQCFLDRAENPGSASERLAIISALRPGFTTTSAQDYKSYPVMELPHGLPDVVTDQLTKIADFATSRRDTVTIGPRFGAEAQVAEIAADFVRGLDELVRDGRLENAPNFLGGLRRALAQAQQTGRLDANLLPSPTTALQHEITEAVKLTLASNDR